MSSPVVPRALMIVEDMVILAEEDIARWPPSGFHMVRVIVTRNSPRFSPGCPRHLSLR